MEQKTTMHPALRRFIEAGERELAELEEPERTIRAAQLHNQMLHKFRPEMFTGEEEFDGNPIDGQPITDKDVEEKIIQDHIDKDDEVAEGDCYNDGDPDSEREPRLPKLKPNPLVEHATAGEIRSWDGRLKEEKIPNRLNSGVIERAPDPELLHNMVAVPEQADLVGMGEIFFADKGYDDCAEYTSRKPYFDRVAKIRGSRYTPTEKTVSTCPRCGQEFAGRKGQKYCTRNCGKRHSEEQKIVGTVKV